MTVKDLIEVLGQMPSDALVYAFDCDTQSDEQVRGLLLEADGHTKAVTICTADE